MKKSLLFLLLIFLPCLLRADSASLSDIQGQWTDCPREDSHTVPRTVYLLEKDTNNKFIGKILTSAFGTGAFNLNGITFDQGKLHFEMSDKSGTMTFNGKLSSDGLSVVGQQSSGADKYEMTLYRLIPNQCRSMDLNDLQAKIDHGDGNAMVEMGYRYYYGDGQKVDLTLAEKMFRQAAEKGISNKLCLNWYFGIGFKQDLSFAFKCLSLLKAYDWIALMRYEGFGVPKNTQLAIDDLNKALNDPNAIEQSRLSWSLEPFYESDKRQGLIFYPDATDDMNELLGFLKEGKSGSYGESGLKPCFPSCFFADNETESVGCTNDESSVVEEKIAIQTRVFFADRSPEVKKIYDEYEKKFSDYQWDSAKAAGFINEGGSMQPDVESSAGAELERDHREEIKNILEKILDFSVSKMDFKTADDELNKEYKKLIIDADAMVKDMPDRYKENDPDYSSGIFKKAERAWIAYRDSAIKLIMAIYADDPNKVAVIERFKIDATLKQTDEIKGYLNPS